MPQELAPHPLSIELLSGRSVICGKCRVYGCKEILLVRFQDHSGSGRGKVSKSSPHTQRV